MSVIVTTPSLYSPLARLAESHGFTTKATEDPYLFSAFYVLFKPFLDQAKDIADSSGLPVAKALVTYMSREKKELRLSKEDLDEGLKSLSEFKKQLGDRVTALYVTDFIEGLALWSTLRVQGDDRHSFIDATCSFIEQLSEQESSMNSANTMTVNGEELITLLEADDNELDLLRISFLTAVEPSFSIFYKYLELALGQRTDKLKEIAVLLTGETALDQYEGILLKFGICSFGYYNQQFKPLSEWWINTLTANGMEAFRDCFISKLDEKGGYRGSLARVSPTDAALINELTAKKGEVEGCNVLLYGSGTLDLRGAFVDIVNTSKLEGIYEINKRVRSSDLPGVVAVAQRLLTEKDLLMVDKADRALSHSQRKSHSFFEMFEKPEPKPEVLSSDELLLSINAPLTFWITSSIDNISQDAIGRFLLHVEVKPASREDKREAIKKLTESLNLTEYARQRLLNYHEISVEQLESAAKLSTIVEASDDERFLATVAASQKALGRDGTEELRESVTKYDLSLLNLQSRYAPDKVIQALKKKNAGTLCFYGMPGTGKTQLAEYIALQLNKPLLVKRASDIFSMWLGESEKNIAKIFDEAKAQGAVLLLDEADSFLRDRALARASWEVTTVNELLTRMEHYNGVFICATNLFEALDAAALRRFTFKFQFRALDAEQRVRMFKNEVGVQLTDDDSMYMDLMSLQYLTPGDFATVQRQVKLFDEELTPEAWIQQLRIESKAKLAGLERQNLTKGEDDLVREITVRG